MRVLYYILKSYIGALVRQNDFRKTDVFRGFFLYFSSSKNAAKNIGGGGGGKKQIFRVLYELNKLSKHFACFPDSYFRFGMFLKGFGSMDLMKSYLPQIAYAKKTIGSTKYNVLIDDKIIFHDIMSYYGLPVPTRYFIYRNGEFRQGNAILSEEDVDRILSKVNNHRIYIKRFTGGAALGVSILQKGKDGAWYNLNKQLITAQSIKTIFGNDGYIFEEQLKQENELARFNPDTVNTIRVLTSKNKVVAATIRFGGKGAFVDNTAKGGVAVSLDIETGMLSEFGMREYDLTHYTEHPDTRLKFKGAKCSQWPEVKQCVEKVLSYIPYYLSVGFDIATTDNGPVIIEINTGAGIYLSQMGKEKGLADSFS